MSDWFKWLKEHCTIKLKAPLNIIDPYTPTTQEDPRTVQSIKRTRAAFKEQEVAINLRAMKAHAAECNDSWTCSAEPCFVREPDKIVNVEAASEKEMLRFENTKVRNKRILRNMNKAREKKK